MELVFAPNEEDLKHFLAQNGRIISTRRTDSLRIQITAVSRFGGILRCVLDLKSRYIRKLRDECYDLLQTPYIVELPNDHPVEDEFVKYTVSQPRNQRVIALKYGSPSGSQLPPTSTETTNGTTKKRRIHNISHLLEDEESYCCQNCFKHFSRKWNLERHAATCIDESILYRCPTCMKKYRKPSYFALHIKSHKEPATSPPQYPDNFHCPVNMKERRIEESNSNFAIPYEFGSFL